MPDILTILECLRPHINTTTIRRWSRIIKAILAMSGQVTMRGISRWTEVVFTRFHSMQNPHKLAKVLILLKQIFAKLTSLGRIHKVSTAVEPS